MTLLSASAPARSGSRTIRELARRLELPAQFHLAWFLEADVRPEEALTVFETARSYFAASPEPPIRFRLAWLEARISGALGEHFAAEQTLLALHATAAEHCRIRDMLLLHLDLIKLAALRGNRKLGAEIAAAFAPLFCSAGLHRQGLAAAACGQEGLRP